MFGLVGLGQDDMFNVLCQVTNTLNKMRISRLFQLSKIVTPSYRLAGFDKDLKTKRQSTHSSFKTASDQPSFGEGSKQQIEDFIQSKAFLKIVADIVKNMETMLIRKKVILNPSRLVMRNYRLFEKKADSKVIKMPSYLPNTNPALEQPSSASGLTRLLGGLVRSMAELRNPASKQSKTSVQVIADLIRNMVSNWREDRNSHNPNNFVRLLKRTSLSKPPPGTSLDDKKDDMKWKRILQDNGQNVAKVDGALDIMEV